MDKPDSIAAPADAEALAAWEWLNEVDHAQWPSREAYVTPRAANLAGRIKTAATQEAEPPAEGKKRRTDAPRSGPVADV